VPDTPASAPASGSKSSSGTFGFLTKRIGPVPIWVIIIALAGLWYWYYHYGPGAQQQQQQLQPKGGRRGQVVNVRIINQPPRRTGVGDIDEDHDHDHDVNPGGPDRGGRGGDEDDAIEDNPRWDRRSDAKHPDNGSRWRNS
jgi:hypothetical protein